MIDRVEIREARPGDVPAIEALYPQAFPDEDLLPLVRDLQDSSAVVFVGLVDNTLLGHTVFTICGLAGRPEKIALLGPLAVTPDRQRQGIGNTIVRAGLARMENDVALVCVLGNPAYYSRFGFEREADVAPPYSLPKEWLGAWQSLRLADDAPPLSGTLIVPDPWRHRALWAPES